MSLFRKNPIFATALTACAVLAAGEAYLIYDRVDASRTAAKKLAAKEAELVAMRDLQPVPSQQVAETIAGDLARAQRAVVVMQAELKGKGAAAEQIAKAKPPTARTEAYFDLATFVEKTRELAKKNDVEIRPEAARLGFALYANEGPKEDRIPAVFHQRQIVQYIVDALIESRPRAIFAVQREHALNKAEKDAIALAAATAAAIAAGQQPPEQPPPPPDGSSTASASEPESPDIFTIDPRVTARAAGYIDTTPVRVVFTGQTGALRNFLNKLASFELPILVREIEVDRASAEESAAAPVGQTDEAPVPVDDAAPASIVITAAAKPKAVPVVDKPKTPTAATIVPNALSKFTVTLEYLDPVAPPVTANPEAPAAEAPAKPTT